MAERRKLIEVALPLEAINREAAREKSIRHGHPSTLHLWWARRPLAAARAVLFAQLVDDPDSRPEAEAIADLDERSTWVGAERARLFRLIEQLVTWDNSTNERVLAEARAEIMRSTDGNPPAILDPFAGGGTIPLEAQRLGLEAHASDLNPVAVLINKALIEIPPKFLGQPPVFPGAADSRLGQWSHATGLAEDVRRYGGWMRDEAEKSIGHLYPKATLQEGPEATVIAWIWTRTVTCPNPACGIRMPLVRSWWLGRKRGKEAYVVPEVVNGEVRYSIGHDAARGPTLDDDGTVGRTGACCIGCGAAVELRYIRSEGRDVGLGSQLMAIVADGQRHRVYLPPTEEQALTAQVARPCNVPDNALPNNPRDFKTPNYGMMTFADLFTNRQLVALVTLSDLVGAAREQVFRDAVAAGTSAGDRLVDGGQGGAAYADAVATYLGFALSKATARNNTMCTWESGMDRLRGSFQRQAIPITWDFAESNPLEAFGGGFTSVIESEVEVLEALASLPGSGSVNQRDAKDAIEAGALVSTDPPYYDNVGYSDLSDFFYVWLRRSLRPIHPALLSTLLVPKAEELVANPYRHGGKDGARKFFESGFRDVFMRARANSPSGYPMTVYYAFKQTETDSDGGTASTGWETLLEGMIRSGWRVTGTWPMRSEMASRMLASSTNALASSIVLALRPRADDAELIGRRGFIAELRNSLPDKLRELQQGSIAPVDLPQSAIGPGMAVFSKYSAVVEADGSAMNVRAALQIVNQVLGEVLSELEGDFDSGTRWCLKWFQSHGFDQGLYGDAETLASAYNTSVSGLARSGALTASGGKVQLFSPEHLTTTYDPRTDDHVTLWEVVLHLAKALGQEGLEAAGLLMSRASTRLDLDAAKELAYLLYSIAEKNRWSSTAQLFNLLAASWADVVDVARRTTDDRAEQMTLGSTY